MTSGEFTQKIDEAKQTKKQHGGFYLATQEFGSDAIEITVTDEIMKGLANTHRWVASTSVSKLRRYMVQPEPYFSYGFAE